MMCPCGSKERYKKCCEPFHKGKKKAKNALILMKSRYCAYAMKQVKYILKTTHKNHSDWNNPNWEKDIKVFCHNEFKKLEIIEFIDGEKEAFVEFKAYVSDEIIHEKSRFVKDGVWLYESGEMK